MLIFVSEYCFWQVNEFLGKIVRAVIFDFSKFSTKFTFYDCGLRSYIPFFDINTLQKVKLLLEIEESHSTKNQFDIPQRRAKISNRDVFVLEIYY